MVVNNKIPNNKQQRKKFESKQKLFKRKITLALNEVDGYKIASIHCYYHHPEMNIFSVCGKLNQIKLNGKVFWANFFWLKIKNLAAVVVA